MSTETSVSQQKPTPRKRSGAAAKAKVTQETTNDQVTADTEIIQSGVVAVIEHDSTVSDVNTDSNNEVLEGELIVNEPTFSGIRVSLGAGDHKSTTFSERTAPWMKIGKLVDGVRTAKEAAVLGGIDFDVMPVPNGYLWNGKWIEITDRRTIVRKDNGMPLGIVSDGYPILQYGEAFDFMDQVNPEYVAAGALKNGKQGFMVAKAPDHFNVTVLGEDRHEIYVVLRTSHNLTRAAEIMIMPLRGLCMNQLTLRSFTRGVEHRWSIRHMGNMRDKLQEAHRAIGKIGEYVTEFTRTANRLAAITVNDNAARKLMKDIFPDLPKTEEKIDRIIQMFNTSETVAYPSTGWGLVNAVGEYYDWKRSGGSPESRFTAALQGQTHNAINKIALKVLSMA